MKRLPVALLALLVALVPVAPATAAEKADPPASEKTYSRQEVMAAAEGFFGKSAEGLGQVVEKLFKEKGRPNGYIKGEEAGGAVAVGLRYGRGTLHLKSGAVRTLYWQGPSVGFDFGGNAAKVFILVYHLPDANAIFQRFPGVDGSLYFVAGVGVNYVQRGHIILAPIRAGVGWRQGASIGYMHFTRKKTWVPF